MAKQPTATSIKVATEKPANEYKINVSGDTM